MTAKTIDEYINDYGGKTKERLILLKYIIRENAPMATEAIKWGMPSFVYNGNLIHFSVEKQHIGLHVGAKVIEKFKDKLDDFTHTKGTIHLKNDKEIPEKLVAEIVIYQVNAHAKKG